MERFWSVMRCVFSDADSPVHRELEKKTILFFLRFSASRFVPASLFVQPCRLLASPSIASTQEAAAAAERARRAPAKTCLHVPWLGLPEKFAICRNPRRKEYGSLWTKSLGSLQTLENLWYVKYCGWGGFYSHFRIALESTPHRLLPSAVEKKPAMCRMSVPPGASQINGPLQESPYKVSVSHPLPKMAISFVLFSVFSSILAPTDRITRTTGDPL
jgi:hypothetical protein